MTRDMSPGDRPVWQDQRAIALLLAATLLIMANATISPALPGLEARFADHPDAVLLTRLLVPAPSLTVLMFAPLAGLVVDRFGRRWVLLLGVVLFAITGSAGLVLTDLTSIFISRLALGVTVAMIMTSQTALIGDYFVGRRRADLMGLQISARNFGGLVFIVLAGWLATSSPQWPFAIYGLAALYLPQMWGAIREPAPRAAPAGQQPHDAHAGGVSTWPVWLFALSCLQLMTTMVFFVMPTQVPFFLDALGYDSAPMTGAALGVLMFAGGCAALLYGRLKRAAGHPGAFALGYGLMAFGFALLPAGAHPWVLFAGAAAVGAGFALVMPNFVAIALDRAPARRRGLAGGMLATALFLGQFVSPFLSMPAISALGFEAMYLGIAVMLGIMALLAAAVRRRAPTTRATGSG